MNGPSFDDIKEYLEDAFNQIAGQERKRSRNPEDYPRKAPITNDEVLLAIGKSEELRRRWSILTRDLHDLFHQIALTQSQVRRAVESSHANIITDTQKYQWGQWRGDWWVMGWGGDEEEG